MTAAASWSIVSGRADGRRSSCGWTPGRGTWVPAQSSARWFGHVPARWDEFQARYRAELAAPERAKALEALAEHARRGPVTLVYGSRDTEHNQAQVIAEEIERRLDVDR